MADPEDVLIDAGLLASGAIGRLWRRRDATRSTAEDEWLADHRARLELLITAIFTIELPIRVSQPPAPPSFLSRLMRPLPQCLRHTSALPATDGRHVFLPRRISATPGLSAPRWFRVLALQQAGRACRGIAALPELAPAGLAHKLYLLCEAAMADRAIAKELPGLAPDLLAARAALLSTRPPLSQLTPPEQALEQLYQRILRAPIDTPLLATTESPRDSWRWAETMAQEISAEHPGRFRGMRRDNWLGALRPVPFLEPTLLEESEEEENRDNARAKTGELLRRPDARQAPEDEDDADPGMWMLQMDDPLEHVEDPMGMQRPTDRDAGKNPDDTADSLSELPQARLVSTPERAKEIFVSDDPPDASSIVASSKKRIGITYPEWDYRLSAYHPAGVTVWLKTCALGDAGWADNLIEQRRALLDEVRRRFEGLRPRRVQLKRQQDGEEIDIDTYVEAFGNLRAGHSIDDRFYQASRPARRDVAISLLIDISGSTDAWIGEGLRIIDVEKEALLVCCHALDTLGDPYAIQAFSGEGPHGVELWPVKGFAERDNRLIQRRIAALEPEQHTRAGAAMRHASMQLAERPEQHRLLLLLSDGKPNDIDEYEGRYGVEDMRQAVNEATAAGIHCFCLTVDRDSPRYLNAIFGPGQHATLRHARNLPVALVDVLRQLLQQS
jgi:nitric oxide reductase NorD protein